MGNGPLSPRVLIPHVFIEENFNFLAIIRVYKSIHISFLFIGREERTGADVKSEQMKRSSSTPGLCCAALAQAALRAQKELCHSAVLGTLAQPPRTPPEGWTALVHPLQSVCTHPLPAAGSEGAAPAACWQQSLLPLS